jgi:DNA-binding MarR family transcriptional regulator
MKQTSAPTPDYLTFHFDVLSGLMKQRATAVYQERAGVSLRDLRVLRFVAAEPGISPSRLVALSHLEKTTVSKLLTLLAQRGFLTREISVDNAKYVNLLLTEAGKRVVAECDVLGRQMEESMLSVLSVRERETLGRCIDKLTGRLAASHDSLDPG